MREVKKRRKKNKNAKSYCNCSLNQKVKLAMNSKFFLVSMKPWAYDKEGDITLFSFCDFCLFELIFLSVNEYFPNGLKSKGHFGFSYQLLLKLPKVRRKKNTKHDFRAFFFFHFKNF